MTKDIDALLNSVRSSGIETAHLPKNVTASDDPYSARRVVRAIVEHVRRGNFSIVDTTIKTLPMEELEELVNILKSEYPHVARDKFNKLEKIFSQEREHDHKRKEFARLADWYVVNGTRLRSFKGEKTSEQIKNQVWLVEHAHKYVLEEKCYNLVDDVASNAAPTAFAGVSAPSGLFWLEGPRSSEGAQEGWLWAGNAPGAAHASIEEAMTEGSCNEGQLAIVSCGSKGDLLSYILRVEVGVGWEPEPALQARFKDMTPEAVEEIMEFAGMAVRFFEAFCMLITSPRTYIEEPVSMAKLNKNRVAHNKPVLSDYTSIKLSVSGPISKRSASNETIVNSRDGSHHGKRLHFVGHFWRTRLGRLEFVRPHWRGNAELGISSGNKKVRA